MQNCEGGAKQVEVKLKEKNYPQISGIIRIFFESGASKVRNMT